MTDHDEKTWTGAHREVVNRLLSCPTLDGKTLNKIKVEVCRKFRTPIPRNSEILRLLPLEERDRFIHILKLKPVRVISGVTVITVMVKPHPCPHGRCVYCPGGIEYGTPAAYTGHEPACMRGIQNDFDPYLQVKSRIEQLEDVGHRVDKVEIIILGGNFTHLPKSYQTDFIKGCLDAVNDVGSNSLEEAKKLAETSNMRNSGITVETRPDLCREDNVDLLLNFGVTRIELGVQTIYDDLYNVIGRGHTVKDVVDSFRVARDSGLAIIAHLMPNLPGSTYEKDLEMFKGIFSCEGFKPDSIKIYPTLVLKGTKLYELWEKGEYKPYTEEVVKLIVEAKKTLPRWVRVQRIQRDIPARLIVAGIKKSNLREIVHERLKDEGSKCGCIRCREVGHMRLKHGLEPKLEDIKLKVERYRASNGEEVFLSYEDVKQDILVGYLRLRYPSEMSHRPEIKATRSMVVRVLQVFGPLVPVGTRSLNGWQHHGFGSLLLQNAEKIAVEDYDVNKVLILSALGVKEYYRKMGYGEDGVYVSKCLK